MIGADKTTELWRPPTYHFLDFIIPKVAVLYLYASFFYIKHAILENFPRNVSEVGSFFKKKMGQPGLFFIYFRSFSNKHQYNFTTINVKKCPSSIRHRDSNPRPSECESPPITTRPGLPPKPQSFVPPIDTPFTSLRYTIKSPPT